MRRAFSRFASAAFAFATASSASRTNLKPAVGRKARTDPTLHPVWLAPQPLSAHTGNVRAVEVGRPRRRVSGIGPVPTWGDSRSKWESA
jgi:hypothetical protein